MKFQGTKALVGAFRPGFSLRTNPGDASANQADPRLAEAHLPGSGDARDSGADAASLTFLHKLETWGSFNLT